MLIESQCLTILVVDDDEGHCELIRRNLRRGGVVNPVVIVHRGDEALDYLHGRDRLRARVETPDREGTQCNDGGDASKPGSEAPERVLVLLDINMPGRLNGMDVLRQIKSDPTTCKIPVIMLTTTDEPHEISRCYDLGCSVYITKPIDAEAFREAIKRLGLFISIVSLAPRYAEIAA
jgi:CheY-like chemotaxis protein